MPNVGPCHSAKQVPGSAALGQLTSRTARLPAGRLSCQSLQAACHLAHLR